MGQMPTIWSLAIDPIDPNILFAGTRPAAVLALSGMEEHGGRN